MDNAGHASATGLSDLALRAGGAGRSAFTGDARRRITALASLSDTASCASAAGSAFGARGADQRRTTRAGGSDLATFTRGACLPDRAGETLAAPASLAHRTGLALLTGGTGRTGFAGGTSHHFAFGASRPGVTSGPLDTRGAGFTALTGQGVPTLALRPGSTLLTGRPE